MLTYRWGKQCDVMQLLLEQTPALSLLAVTLMPLLVI